MAPTVKAARKLTPPESKRRHLVALTVMDLARSGDSTHAMRTGPDDWIRDKAFAPVTASPAIRTSPRRSSATTQLERESDRQVGVPGIGAKHGRASQPG